MPAQAAERPVPSAAPASSPRACWPGLALALALALGLRALGWEWVLVDADTVVWAPGDAQYHFRRALYGWMRFPDVLFFDPYINYPGGAAISWPPLFDFGVSTFGRLLAGDLHAFQRLAAWTPPVVGALALLPVHALGRRIGGPGLGVGAAALLALLPMSINYSRVGQLDHHCAVAAIGAFLLWTVARLADGDRASPGLAAALAAGRVAMLLTWHGSLLYLALVEGVLWLTAAVTGRRELYRLQATSALASLAVVAPLVWLFPEPLGGPWSAIALSRLHVLAVSAVVLVSAGLWGMEGRAGARSPVGRLAWTAGLGLAVLALLLVLPATQAGLDPALRFLTMRDGVGYRTGEQLPLFSLFGRATGRPVWSVWGGFGYLLPLLPFAVAWAAPREHRGAALVVAAWCAWFGGLALVQRRYGNDLGPAAAVGFALVLAAGARRLPGLKRSPRWRATAMAGVAVLLLSPVAVGQWLPRLASGWAALDRDPAAGDPALRTPAGSLTRFLEQVRAVTPETSGYFDPKQEPEYGVVAHANFGHAIQNVARRPTPTDPFWAFIGAENWHAAFGLLASDSEEEALAFARRLRARYVMSFSSADPATVEGWLHFADGLAVDRWPAARHFRLVSEGPDGGAHFADSFQVQGRGRPAGGKLAPYKLFEVVDGARIEISTVPGSEVTASLRLRTPSGRGLFYEARAVAAPDGGASLRVPYPTRNERPATGVRALGPYRLRADGRSFAVAVSERQVRSGAVVPVVEVP